MTERLAHLGIMRAYMMALEPLEHAMVSIGCPLCPIIILQSGHYTPLALMMQNGTS